MFESRISATATEKDQDGRNLTQRLSHGLTRWMDMLTKCVERYCELANEKDKATIQSFNSLPGLSHLQEGGV